jgi:hypothetical protein
MHWTRLSAQRQKLIVFTAKGCPGLPRQVSIEEFGVSGHLSEESVGMSLARCEQGTGLWHGLRCLNKFSTMQAAGKKLRATGSWQTAI